MPQNNQTVKNSSSSILSEKLKILEKMRVLMDGVFPNSTENIKDKDAINFNSEMNILISRAISLDHLLANSTESYNDKDLKTLEMINAEAEKLKQDNSNMIASTKATQAMISNQLESLRKNKTFLKKYLSSQQFEPTLVDSKL